MYGFDWKEAAEPVATPKYKVGQRVRVVDDIGGGRLGDIATVTGYERTSGGVYYGLDGLSDDACTLLERRLKPIFSPGDRVRVTRCNGYFAAGDEGVVEKQGAYNIFVKHGPHQNVGLPIEPEKLEWLGRADSTQEKASYDICVHPTPDTIWMGGKRYDVVRPWPSSPCIVARVLDGKPRPSNIPFVHSSSAAALTEAERLAKNNPGQEFAVYQRVAGRVAEVSYSMKEVA